MKLYFWRNFSWFLLSNYKTPRNENHDLEDVFRFIVYSVSSLFAYFLNPYLCFLGRGYCGISLLEFLA